MKDPNTGIVGTNRVDKTNKVEDPDIGIAGANRIKNSDIGIAGANKADKIDGVEDSNTGKKKVDIEEDQWQSQTNGRIDVEEV